MPTKAERILEYLPRSFLPAPARSALRAVVGAVGGELQQAEVSLARVLRAHWVDSADEGAALIDDLAQLASMWGLAPLRDSDGSQLETVEQFRDHLKRHVRTVLEGRVTVRGLLNVAAETLGIRIAEGDDVDVWWNRRSPWLVTTEPAGEDAAALVFGGSSIDARGADAQPAVARGTIDLTAGVNLEAGSRLRLQVDDQGSRVIDLAQGLSDRRAVPLAHIVQAINAEVPSVASAEAGLLVLRSIRTGPGARLEIEEVEGDAALAVLGVPAHIYTGLDPRAAEVRSSLDLSGGLELGPSRFLRLTVDGTRTIEVDVADPTSPLTVLDRIRDAINEALGADFASHDNRFLTVRSPVTGAQSSVFVLEPAAQDCARQVFGESARFVIGTEARPATVTSIRDLSRGIDLSERSMLRLGIDGAPPVALSCAGADPARTTVQEIVDILNAAVGPGFARTDGRLITLTSRVAGGKGEMLFSSAPENDALQDVLGFGPRVFTGTAAVPASITGSLDLSGGVDLTGSRWIGLILDDGPLQRIELPVPEIRRPRGAERPEDVRRTQLQQIAEAIDAVVGQDIASRTATQLVLTSQTIGGGSRLAVVPLDREVRRRFVSRAAVQDEAAHGLLGFVERRAEGKGATPARVVSTVDLRFGVDLREDHWLRISVDGQPGITFSCAGPRPQATTVEDIVAALTAHVSTLIVDPDPEALSLTSPSPGARSRITFEPVLARDATERLFGVEPGEVRGQDAGSVLFRGTVDLSNGVELPPGAAVRVGIDAVPAAEVVLNGGDAPVRRTLNEIVNALNEALQGAFAGHDGRSLTLTSRERGEASRLSFEAAAIDATRTVFGIAAPRLYQAEAATPAVLQGRNDLPDEIDLSVTRFLRIAVDGQAAKVVDCAIASDDPNKATLEQVRGAINQHINALAHLDGRRLVLKSRSLGSGSRVRLEPHVAGDAKARIFGAVPDDTRGTDGSAAEIVGEVSLAAPVDLSLHRHLLLRIDGGRPVEIDVAGQTPEQTTLDEVVEAVNRILPGVASRTPDRQLRLRGPAAGTASTIEVLARRFLELVEYPTVEERLETGPIGHGERIAVVNTGVAEAVVRVEFTSLHGTVAPGLVNHRSGKRITLDLALRAGERVLVEATASGPRATLIPQAGPPRVLDAHEVRLEDTLPEPLALLLDLGRGTTDWTFLECVGPRFDSARFDEERYPGSPCQTVGMFDIGRLDGALTHDPSIYAPVPMPPPSARLSFAWSRHQAGAFELRLPAELPPLFGGRFNEARYGIGVGEKEVELKEVGQAPVTTTALVARRAAFPGVVLAPDNDSDHISQAMASPRALLEVHTTRKNVPLGFVAAQAPFREPRFLSLGEFDQKARLFIVETATGKLTELKAADFVDAGTPIPADPGQQGTRISVSLRPDGRPGRYLFEVGFPGDRFECARALVLGPPEGAATGVAAGILQAKAAGVRARVARERTKPSRE